MSFIILYNLLLRLDNLVSDALSHQKYDINCGSIKLENSLKHLNHGVKWQVLLCDVICIMDFIPIKIN